MSWPVVLATLPWLALGAALALRVREPRPLPPAAGLRDAAGGPGAAGLSDAPDTPRVTVIVPARNEAHNIAACLTSLAAQAYPDFSIVAVDDRSNDGTAEAARRVPAGNARELRVMDGQPLPRGWFGKPWACLQGARVADGALLLFTDADTRHQPLLLRRAVAGLREDRAAALTLLGHQELHSFGERLVQPQIFALLALRYPRLDRPIDPESSADALANGQYILVSAEAYRSIGGHEAVRDEVVEDLRLAQVLTTAGHRLTFRGATEDFSVRMYRSLREVVEGWTKNLAVGARQASGRWRDLVLPGLVGFLFGFWILPPLLLLGTGTAAAIGRPAPEALLAWSAAATVLSAGLWVGIYRRFGVSGWFACLYPIGAGITAFIAIRSWIRGTDRIEWKGRRYAGGKAADAPQEGA